MKAASLQVDQTTLDNMQECVIIYNMVQYFHYIL